MEVDRRPLAGNGCSKPTRIVHDLNSVERKDVRGLDLVKHAQWALILTPHRGGAAIEFHATRRRDVRVIDSACNRLIQPILNDAMHRKQEFLPLTIRVA